MLKQFSVLCLASASCLGAGMPSSAQAQQGYYYAERVPAQASYNVNAPRRNGGGLIGALFGDDTDMSPRYQVQQQPMQRQRVYQQPQYQQPQDQQSGPDDRQQQTSYQPPSLFPQMQMMQPEPQPQPQMMMRRQQDSGDPARPGFDPKFEKQMVEYQGNEAPGTIIVDTPNKFLFLVQGNGRALRYGIGVGRPGFTWRGVKAITAKKEWPAWTPPPEMLARRPDLPRHMEGGPENPLGARAMYLGSSLYRIHGSNEPWTIGTNVSSGCFRMRNEDVIDLYGRVKVGAKVTVI
ncbi:MAG: ErfK/YbiS/YcfS/YnhG family protein [Tardiphaga sp.]|nr:ErfK/YbiS/YcfS/YnhG family protein [Tardiphaga sp.]